MNLIYVVTRSVLARIIIFEASASGPEEARQVSNSGAAGVDPGDPHGDAQQVGLGVVVKRPPQDERRPVEQRNFDGGAGETGEGGHDGSGSFFLMAGWLPCGLIFDVI